MKYNLTREEHDGVRYVVARGVGVELEEGIVCRPAESLSQECGRYRNNIFFSNNENVGKGKSILSLMLLVAYHGRKLDVFVEDLPGTNPEKIARRLCSGLTTKDFYPDFGRREE
jgi:phosphotransferase system HPr (HPr) family protein